MAKTDKVKKDFFTKRELLWYLVFVGFAINYMVRINLNIAIVSMVAHRPANNNTLTSECFTQSNSSDIHITTNQSDDQPGTTLRKIDDNVTNDALDAKQSGKFFWNEYHQGLILGAYFWLHWLTQIPGGILSQKYGTKMVFGLSNFVGIICCFAIPSAAYMGYTYLIIIRVFQGLVTGFAWPAMHNMAAKWIPPNERSKFVTAYLGSSIGVAVTYPMCGWIIDRWGWELVFYVNGIMGTCWYIMWWLFVYDSPSEHPTISDTEKEYILSSLGHSVTKKKAPVPWKALLTSLPLWVNVFAQWGGIWGLFTLLTHAPMYFKFVHGWNITATGLFSGMPHILRMGFAYAFSQLGDYLLRSNKLSRTNVRKLATTMCTIVQGLCMLCLAYSGCNSAAAIVFLSAATAVNGAVSTGPLASLVDISPNYASICLGMCNTIVAIVGFIVPAVVSYLTYQNQTVAQWQKVFWTAAIQLSLSGIIYILFSKSELQPWNSPETQEITTADSELECLKGAAKKEANIKNGSYDPLPAHELKTSEKC